jgi:hypothetical protein
MPYVLRASGLLAVAMLWCVSGSAGQAEFGTNATVSSTSAPGMEIGTTNLARRIPPAPPGTRTAADTFRELLAMTPAERTQALANRNEYQRQYLQDRLREYEALSPEIREERLRQLELKCYLPDLMKLPPAKRGQRLETIPAYLRPLVEDRLKQWDALPASVQKEVLDYETTAEYFIRAPARLPGQNSDAKLTSFPPVPTDDKGRKALDSLNDFVSLSSKAQEKALEGLPPAEREEMEKTLQAFSKLTPEQRKTCINSFAKLYRMTPDQREQFLKNAERWKSMSPGERETWRTLIKILPSGGDASPGPPVPVSVNRLTSPVAASNAASPPEFGRP